MRITDRRSRYPNISILALGLVLCTPVKAADVSMPAHAKLTGAQEVPPVKTPAAATSTITISPDMAVSGSVETSGIDGTMAHIHQGVAGTNGPPIITLVKSSATQWSVPPGSKLTPAQFDLYKAGDLYVNVHSAAHPSGEIRMQLQP